MFSATKWLCVFWRPTFPHNLKCRRDLFRNLSFWRFFKKKVFFPSEGNYALMRLPSAPPTCSFDSLITFQGPIYLNPLFFFKPKSMSISCFSRMCFKGQAKADSSEFPRNSIPSLPINWLPAAARCFRDRSKSVLMGVKHVWMRKEHSSLIHKLSVYVWTDGWAQQLWMLHREMSSLA